MKTKTLNECKEIIAIKHEYSDFAQIEMTDDEPWEKMETKGRIMCQAAELYASQFQQKDVQPASEWKNDKLNGFNNGRDTTDGVGGDAPYWESMDKGTLSIAAPSKTLQEMLEKEYMIMNETTFNGFTSTHKQTYAEYLDEIGDLRQAFTQGFHAGQSSPSLSKELVEWTKEILKNQIEAETAHASLYRHDKTTPEYKNSMANVKEFERFLTELTQLTNGTK